MVIGLSGTQTGGNSRTVTYITIRGLERSPLVEGNHRFPNEAFVLSNATAAAASANVT